MPVFLLMLLAAIALVITVVGYLLSANKTQSRNQQTPYKADYLVPRTRQRINESMPLRTARASEVVPLRSGRLVEPRPVTLQTRRVVSVGSRRVANVQYAEPGIWTYMLQLMAVGTLLRPRRVGEPTPWMGVTLILLSVFLLGVFLLKTLMPNATLIGAMAWSYTNTQSSSQQKTPSGPFTASQSLVRLSQLDPSQYNSSQEYNLWAYSACSTASLTEVINAYGHHYRITDILKVESAIGEITPQLGLLEEVGIARTATHFGFTTNWGHNLSLDQVISVANHGQPVIVDFPPDRYAGGHLLVVIGGNSSSVFLADSSLWNRKSLSRSQFMYWWEGFSAILTPNK